jgi:hypothetical protein
VSAGEERNEGELDRVGFAFEGLFDGGAQARNGRRRLSRDGNGRRHWPTS